MARALPPGRWWQLPLLLGPLVWFGLPLLLHLPFGLLAALLADAHPLLRPFARVALGIVAAGMILEFSNFGLFPLLLPAIAIAVWLLGRGHLSWWLWGPGIAAVGAVLGALFALPEPGGPSWLANLAFFTAIGAACALANGLAFRAAIQPFLRTP
jgi:hypothetical protein